MKISFPITTSEIKIKMKRHNNFGEGKVYTIEIFGTGEVTITSNENEIISENKTQHRIKISQLKVVKLLEYASEIGFFEMRNEYYYKETLAIEENMLVRNISTATDMPIVDIEIHLGKKKKKITDYYGTPKRLQQFENKIDSVCTIKQWIFLN